MRVRRATAAPPPGFSFHRRLHPSANTVVVDGRWPVLVDTGFVTAAAETIRLVESLPSPGDLGLCVLTHFHSDHAGGAGDLRRRLGIPIALHRSEAASVNARDPDACDARWLGHPIAPFCIDVPLEHGDVLTTGTIDLRVVHVPGQTPGVGSRTEGPIRLMPAPEAPAAACLRQVAGWRPAARRGDRTRRPDGQRPSRRDTWTSSQPVSH